MALIKTMTVDDYYLKDDASRIYEVVRNLNFKETHLGKEIVDFNMVSDDADVIFNQVFPKKVKVDLDKSGIFRYPELFIHFEDFESLDDWMFVVAIDSTTFNIFEHKSGAKSAIDNYKFNYQNLFEWDLTVNYQLAPGQGVFFRPWLFHSFSSGLIQMFRLKEE